MYLSQLCLRDNDGNTPLHLAIKNEAPKSIEMILQGLGGLPHLRLSNLFFPLFPELFKSGVTAFETFLGNCTFRSREMIETKRMGLKDMESSNVYISNFCSLFSHQFKE